MKDDFAILLFDGVCNLCNSSVNFIMKFDRKKKFRFGSFQLEAGKNLCTIHQIPENTDSVILIWKNSVYTESDAFIEVCRLLPYPFRMGVAIKILPASLRNRIYRFIAKNRFRWFGKRQSCRVATQAEKKYFIE